MQLFNFYLIPFPYFSI